MCAPNSRAARATFSAAVTLAAKAWSGFRSQLSTSVMDAVWTMTSGWPNSIASRASLVLERSAGRYSNAPAPRPASKAGWGFQSTLWETPSTWCPQRTSSAQSRLPTSPLAPVMRTRIPLCTRGAQACPILRLVVRPVGAALHALPPFGMLDVPAHRLLEALLEAVLRRPPQLRVRLRRIDGVASVVPGAIFHKAD